MKKQKKYTLGSWITIGHPSIVEVMSLNNFDWLCIDTEHTVIDYFEIQQLLTIMDAKNIFSYVRVSENNPSVIKRVLDAGAKGIIVPLLNTKDQAIEAVNSTKYPPIGTRGVNKASRAQNYGFGFEEYAKKVNKMTKVIAQIEHINAINNLDEILSVDGIDGTIIGPYDLSASLNLTAKFNEQEFLDVIAKQQKKKYIKF